MRIILFGGTTEGRLLAEKLTGWGHSVTVSVATPIGAEGLAGVRVLAGRLEEDAMTDRVRGFDLCVDATHPYARAAHETIKTACTRAGVPRCRVSRPPSEEAGCIVVGSAEEAAAYLRGTEGSILLTTGAKEIAAFRELSAGRLFARVLPTHESLDACESIGLPHRNILALWGPFSAELNAALLRQYAIRWLVTKDGGKAGGFFEKLRAAAETDTAVLLIRRPQDTGLSVETFLDELRKGVIP